MNEIIIPTDLFECLKIKSSNVLSNAFDVYFKNVIDVNVKFTRDNFKNLYIKQMMIIVKYLEEADYDMLFCKYVSEYIAWKDETNKVKIYEIIVHRIITIMFKKLYDKLSEEVNKIEIKIGGD